MKHHLLAAVVAMAVLVVKASPQSNYADRGLDVEYQGNGIPLEATLDGIVTQLDDLSNVIHTNRTTASLSCASRAMEVDLEFNEPFYGIVYADFSRTSACSLVGEGLTKYHFELPLSGCGTSQDPLRVFTNNIIVRFHPSLELERDEVKTIVCRYPEPIVPPPLNPPLPVSVDAVPPGDLAAEKLTEMPILLIICCLLFLAMMLFGVACSYVCLKHRNIRLVRHTQLLSSGPGSAITKMSDQTIFPPMFEGLKIPRAHASASNSGSEQLIVEALAEHSDTLPSDYPSETHSFSEMEFEGDMMQQQQQCEERRPSTISSVGREQLQMVNQAYIPDDDVERLSSVYSDAHVQFDVDMFGLPTLIPRVDPTFDVAFRVRDRPRSPAPSSVTSVESDVSRAQYLQSQERALTTILEREEWLSSQVTKGQARRMPIDDLNPPPNARHGPPVDYAQVIRKEPSIAETEAWSNAERSITEHEDIPRVPLSPAQSLSSLNTEMTDPHSIAEIIMKSSRMGPEKKAAIAPAAEPCALVQTQVVAAPTVVQESKKSVVINEEIHVQTSILRQVSEEEERETMIVPIAERPIPPPKLTTQEVDDVYLKTVTETRIVEENERIRRQMMEYHQRPRQPQPLPPNWDVTIRQHPPPPPQSHVPSESTNWDDMSMVEPLNAEWDVKIRQYPPPAYEPSTPSVSTNWDGMSTAEGNMAPDWDVKIRQYPPVYEPRTPSVSTNWDGQSQVEAEPEPEPETQQPSPEWDVKIRQHPPVYEPREPSDSTNWDAVSTVTDLPEAQPPPDWDVKIRQYPPVYPPRTPSESTNWDGMSTQTDLPEAQPPPDWDVSIRQYPPVYPAARSPSEMTRDSREGTPSVVAAPDWDVSIRQYPPVYPAARSPSEMTRESREGTPSVVAAPEWDVSIRQYPAVYEAREPSEYTDWDGVSQTDSQRTTGARPEWDVRIRQYPPPGRALSDVSDWDQQSDGEWDQQRLSRKTMNWDVLIRVLNAPIRDDSDTASVLTIEDRQKWHQIITTESTLRTMLTEAVVTEDFERIRRDVRFERIFEAPKWDVIIRVLAPPAALDDDTSDSRSETTVNSEPPENSVTRRYHRRPSVLTALIEAPPSHASDDVRSITETTVDQTYQTWKYDATDSWRRPDWDDQSERMSRPSLARSTSEFTDYAVQRLPYDRVSAVSDYSYASSAHRQRAPAPQPHDVPEDSGDSQSLASTSPRQAKRVPYQRVSSLE